VATLARGKHKVGSRGGGASALEAACRWLDNVKWGVDAKAAKVERSGIC
jgi:hypothetical protein